ncbi:MAG: Sigma-70, region 4 [Verrucomicrobiota bacterium]|jgi:DNA-directed RNA polymerase specialized sigma24 family protein
MGSDAFLPPEFFPEKDVMLHLEQDIRNWPRDEREVFELYFVEGLEPEEIAMVMNQSREKIQEVLASIQQRMREQTLEKQAVA